MKKNLFLLAIVAVLGLAYLMLTQGIQTNPSGVVVRTLQAQGFDDIQIASTIPSYCDDGERAYSFSATTSTGGPAAGVVCVRLFPEMAYIRYK